MPKGKDPIPVIWNDVEYASISEAAESLGITYQAMQYRLKKGYTNDDDLNDFSNSEYHNGMSSNQCQWDDIEFNSIRDAADFYNITIQAMYKRLKTRMANEGIAYDGTALPSHKKQVKVTLSSDMVALLEDRYGTVNADTVRQAIADLFEIENNVQHGGSRKGAGRPTIHDLECQGCGHKWRETLPTLGCPECDSEEFWTL